MNNEVFEYKLLKSLIFRFHPTKDSLISRESTKLEFKENFNFAEIAEYMRDFASFSNNSGGYLVFGVKDSPHTVTGINGDIFDNIDEEKITGFINEYFAPTINWEKTVFDIKNVQVGIIYVCESTDKPIIAIKDGGRGQEIKNGEIYYRYTGRSQKIRFPELKRILEMKLEIERRAWQEHLERMVKIGATNVAILDTVEGKIEGTAGTILIDDDLIPKLKFIREGQFVEKTGKPTLKLVGELKPASVVQKVVHDDPYVYRASDVASKVQEKIKRPFKTNPHHTNAWKLYKIRIKQKDGSWKINPRYCDYKAAIDYFLYNKSWIDFLSEELLKPTVYKKIVRKI